MTPNLPAQRAFAVRQHILRLEYRSIIDQKALWNLLENEMDIELKVEMLRRVNPNLALGFTIFWVYKKDEHKHVHGAAFNRLKLVLDLEQQKEAYKQVLIYSTNEAIQREAEKAYQALLKVTVFTPNSRVKPVARQESAKILHFPNKFTAKK